MKEGRLLLPPVTKSETLPMIYVTGASSTLDSCALNGALAIARLAGWRFERRPELPPVLAGYPYDPAADVVLIPSTTERGSGLVARAVREVRCTAVMVAPGCTTQGDFTLYATITRAAGGDVHEHRGLRLWMDWQDACWLAPDPDGDDPLAACFRLDARSPRPTGAPWADEQEHEFGFGNADLQLQLLMKRPGPLRRC